MPDNIGLGRSQLGSPPVVINGTSTPSGTAAPPGARTAAEKPAQGLARDQMGMGIGNPNAGPTAETANGLGENSQNEVQDCVKKLTEYVKNADEDIKKALAQIVQQNKISAASLRKQGEANHNDSLGKKTVMARSISSAFPVIGTALFVVGGLALLTGGPFGFLMGAAFAYGAFSLYKAVKNEQEADLAKENRVRNDNDDDTSGDGNSVNIDRPPHPMSSAASVSPKEEKEDETDSEKNDESPAGQPRTPVQNPSAHSVHGKTPVAAAGDGPTAPSEQNGGGTPPDVTVEGQGSESAANDEVSQDASTADDSHATAASQAAGQTAAPASSGSAAHNTHANASSSSHVNTVVVPT